MTLCLHEPNHLHLSLANPFMLETVPPGSLEGTDGAERSKCQRHRRIKLRAAGCSHQVEDGKPSPPLVMKTIRRSKKHLTVSDPES